MTRGLLSLAALGTAVAVLTGCSASHPTTAAETIAVRTASARVHEFRSSLVLSGNLVAQRRVTLGADAGGRVTSAPLQVGDRVAAGDVVASIDDAASRAAVAQAQGAQAAAQANVGVASAQPQQANARYALARTTASRMTYLYSQGAISRQQYDQSQSDLATARAAIVQSQAAIGAAAGSATQSSGALAAAAVPLAHATIRAPFSGLITSKAVDVGAVVAPGAAVYTLEDDRDLEVDLPVPEDSAPALLPGTRVTVLVDALGRSVAGRVRAVVPADGATHSALVKVSVAAERGMLSGMYARVTISGKPSRAVAVPRAAMAVRAGQSGVFVLDGSRAEFLPVETGASDGLLLAVRGVTPGRRVIVSDVALLNDGAAVTPQ